MEIQDDPSDPHFNIIIIIDKLVLPPNVYIYTYMYRKYHSLPKRLQADLKLCFPFFFEKQNKYLLDAPVVIIQMNFTICSRKRDFFLENDDHHIGKGFDCHLLPSPQSSLPIRQQHLPLPKICNLNKWSESIDASTLF